MSEIRPPEVSIVLPVGYVDAHTPLALAAVIRAGEVSSADCEVLVVLNGVSPTDESIAAHLDHPSVRVITYPRQIGPAAARAAGASHALGSYICWTDADCVVPREWIDALVEGCRAHPVCVTKVEAANVPKTLAARIEERIDTARNAVTTASGTRLYIANNSVMIRSAAFVPLDLHPDNTIDDIQLSLDLLLHGLTIGGLASPVVRVYYPDRLLGALQRRTKHAKGFAYLERERYAVAWHRLGLPTPGEYLRGLPRSARDLRLSARESLAYVMLQTWFVLAWSAYRLGYVRKRRARSSVGAFPALGLRLRKPARTD